MPEPTPALLSGRRPRWLPLVQPPATPYSDACRAPASPLVAEWRRFGAFAAGFFAAAFFADGAFLAASFS
jgi:hypothetical protein